MKGPSVEHVVVVQSLGSVSTLFMFQRAQVLQEATENKTETLTHFTAPV